MRSILACLPFLLTGCATIPQNEGKPTNVSDVVKKIKQDLSIYQKYDASAAGEKPIDNACHGAVSFSISDVKVSLTTQIDDTDSGSASLTLPVGSGTFGPLFSGLHEVKGSQITTFTLYPKQIEIRASKDAEAPKPIDASFYPIAAGLQQLRDGLLDASQIGPCVSLIPPPGDDGKPAKDDGETFTFGFTVINQSTGGENIKFVLFSLGANNTSQRQAANTITVTFKARSGSEAIQ